MKINTRLVKAGGDPDPTTGALVPPIYASSTFERDPDGSYSRGYVYSRWANPTRTRLEETLADLEGGFGACVFPAGMSAIDTLLRTLDPGDHVLLADDVYHATRQLLREVLSASGIAYSEADYTHVENVAAAIRPETRLVWIETPSNPLCKISDIQQIAGLCEESGAEVVVDNTWMTPLLQRPFELGADYVVHSMTKYLSGHSDVLAGGVVAKRDTARFARLQHIQRVAGAVASPFDCWLTMRGIRSLGARMKMHCHNARRVAEFLSGRAGVSRVHYPGLPDHPMHEVALRQMDDFGAMMSFEVDGTEQDAVDVAARVRLFVRATSLGGTESLIEHRASIESKPTSTPTTLLRLSIGLEDVDDLIRDLDQAIG